VVLRASIVLLLIGVLLPACSRQAVVGSPGTPGADPSEAMAREELADLHAAQERYFEANGRYTNQLSELQFSRQLGVEVSIIQGDRRGYSAVAEAGESECAVFGGEARPPRSYVTRPGLVGCRP
jgi:hypothetical protein